MGGVWLSSAWIQDRDKSRRVASGPYYLFFRRLFWGVGTNENVEDVRSAGIIGAAFTVVLTLTFPEGVSVVFVLMRMISPRVRCLCKASLPESRVVQSCWPDREVAQHQGRTCVCVSSRIEEEAILRSGSRGISMPRRYLYNCLTEACSGTPHPLRSTHPSVGNLSPKASEMYRIDYLLRR